MAWPWNTINNENVQSYVVCETVTKYSGITFVNLDEYIVEIMQL